MADSLKQASVTSERWERAKRIFEAALEQSPQERGTFVAKACQGDDELRAEVKNLLSGDAKAEAGDFLKEPAMGRLTEIHAEAKPHTLARGEIVSGRFEVIRFIGQGGMGEVYEARDLELGERVALKTIRSEDCSDARGLARFKKEVQLARRVTHANVCRIFDLERHQPPSTEPHRPPAEVIFLTMEMLEGETLAARLRRVGRLTTAEALPIVEQMAEALAAAHAVGVVHRDFKPGNVMLVPSSSGSGAERAVVTDFGLARAVGLDGIATDSALQSSLTASGHFVGTVAYMAPEQLRGGEITARTDVYALGLVMYEMLAGKRPSSPPAAIAQLDPKWEAAILRCLESDPAKRFASARDVIKAIRGTSGASSTLDSPPVLVEPGFSPAPATPPGGTAAALRSLFFGTRKRILASAFAILAVALSAALLRHYLLNRFLPQVPAGSQVLLTDVENETKDAELNGVTELLRNQLEQSAYFNLVSLGQIREALERMVRPADQKLDPVTARQVAYRSGAPLVVFGSISSLAQEFTLALRIEKVGSDPNYDQGHWTQSLHASNKKEIYDAVREASKWVREKVGEATKDVLESDRPPQDVTTSSWEALRLYIQATDFSAQGNQDDAVRLLKEAAVEDPQFSLAYMRLGDILTSLNNFSEGYELWQKALSTLNSRRLTLREELHIKGMSAMDLYDFKTAEEVYSSYRIHFPNDYLGPFYRARPLMMLGRTEEAITSLLEAYQKRPNSVAVLAHLARYNMILARNNEARNWIDKISGLGERTEADYLDGELSFLKGDYGKAEAFFRSAASSESARTNVRSNSLRACLLAELGRYREAEQVLKAGINAEIPVGRRLAEADKLLALAYLYYKQGRRADCRDACLRALEIDTSFDRSLQAGTLLSRMGFAADARRILQNLAKKNYRPISEIVRLRLEGEISLADGKMSSALHDFETAAGLQAPAIEREFLARAYTMAGNPEKAWDIYQQIVQAPGLIWQDAQYSFPGFWADALYQYVQLGATLHKPDARASLDSYLRTRSGADSALPDVVNARRISTIN